MLTAENVMISTLGKPDQVSPLPLSSCYGDGIGNFVPDEARIRHDIEATAGRVSESAVLMEKAGPREYLFFDPAKTRAAIVTCGGLCPGLNNVIRSIFRQLSNYGVNDVLGIRNGYLGMNPAAGLPPLKLTNEMVEHISKEGGTILGSSRGPQDTGVLVDFLAKEQINMLFCIGGDGTQRGAHDLAMEIGARKLDIGIIGIPKTIDNDIRYTSRSFGFHTAIDEARHVLDCAHAEARGALNGVGLVKVMGRASGFIAAYATLASQEVNFCLIPEVPFKLTGPDGFMQLLKTRIGEKKHAVIAVAEGAGQELIPGTETSHDASGNALLQDIGLFLKKEIKASFAEDGLQVNVKYIDPSYIIRSVPANSDDSLLCDQFARHAVHAGMAGKTDMLIGLWNDAFTHIPIAPSVAEKKFVDPESELWISVYEATSQPLSFAV